MTYVVGIDACRGGWVAVSMLQGRTQAALYPTFADVLDAHQAARVVGVDIPIGSTETGVRRADIEARRMIGPRRSSVFATPPRPVLHAPRYEIALAIARKRYGWGISKQSYALVRRILEVDPFAAADRRIVEVHPEVSFRAMAGRPLDASKKTPEGRSLRRRLLKRHGMSLVSSPGAGKGCCADDVLDASAAAWSANRFTGGVAVSLPEPPEIVFAGRPVAIWY